MSGPAPLVGLYDALVVFNALHGQDGCVWVVIDDLFTFPGLKAKPCLPFASPGFGFAFLPPVGSRVWIAFERGNPAAPVWVGAPWAPVALPTDPPLTTLLTTGVLWGPTFRAEFSADAIQLTYASVTTVRLDAKGVTIQTPGAVDVQGVQVSLNSPALVVT